MARLQEIDQLQSTLYSLQWIWLTDLSENVWKNPPPKKKKKNPHKQQQKPKPDKAI